MQMTLTSIPITNKMISSFWPRYRDLFIIFFICLCMVFPVSASSLYLDTLNSLQIFTINYNEFLINKSIPLWDPFTAYGVISGIRDLIGVTALQYIFSALGILFNIKNAFYIYKISLFFELFILTTGVYMLVKSLKGSGRSALFSAVVMALTSVVYVQIWFNFRVLVYFPWILFLATNFIEKQNVRFSTWH